jgi:hypothetical protein
MVRHHRDVGALYGTALKGEAVANDFMGLSVPRVGTRYGPPDDR